MENRDEHMEDEDVADASISEEEFRAQAQQRHQETEDMNMVLEMVAPSGRSEGRLEFSGMEQELEKIEREQNEVLQRLEEASQTPATHEVPAALTNIIGTWRALPDQNRLLHSSLSQHAPASLYKYLWFKVDGFNLHCVLFTGHNHQRRLETVGMECDGELEGTRKMTYVEASRLVTSHRRMMDGAEVMRVEIFVQDEQLHYVFQKEDFSYVKVYVKAFPRI